MEEFENNPNVSEQTADAPQNNAESAAAEQPQQNPYQGQNYQQPVYQQQAYQQQNQYQQYRQPQYQPQYQQQYYRPQQQYGQYQQYGGYAGNRYGGTYSQTSNGTVYQQRTVQNTAPAAAKEKKGASKGFVIAMTAIGLVIAMLLSSAVTLAMYKKYESKTPGTVIQNNGDVVIHKSDADDQSVTDRGSNAYAASVALDTVVEVRTETEQHSSFFQQYVTEGAGSGIIISSTDDGSFIITCAHVIEGATKVTVTLSDGTEYEAVATACDTITDIGFIKINVKGLKTATVGDSDKIVVAEDVIAIGNPLGELGGSVTSGIISALEREIQIDGLKYKLIQTSAEISPGNSGGGLFNMKGELIGVVNAKSVGEDVEGLGFAIPINGALKIFTELVKNGRVAGRVKLGVSVVDIQTTDDYYQNFKYRKYFTEYGVYIISSEDSKLHEGDRIVSIDNIAVGSYAELRNILLEYKVGDVVKIQVSRINSNNRSELITVEITLKEANG
ncbi:MAG: trypsin-like peptidase domain-containing protein [Clostridia bacterium]|nr:trypsin-like peptidase domain-containing protein [Clostridia bacterium]